MPLAQYLADLRPGWFARATISGLVASLAMLATFLIAYGLATALAGIELTSRRGATELRQWLSGLTHNPLIDFAQSWVYLTLMIFFVGGILWAVLYAAVFEPRLSGPAWLRGLIYSLVPGVLSLVIFLPIVGGGFFGMHLGAGPLPIVGSLVIHTVYGVVLGVVYGPLGDLVYEDRAFVPATGEDAAANLGAEHMAMIGMLVGVAVGLIVGVAAEWALQVQGGVPLGLPVGALTSMLVLVGAAFGGVLGSLLGLPTTS
ncbi:MAG: hypothetical protein HY331_07230 [Chloroflexi bacterium]|nr:hypothetical protein [Chloroflexota bacterium]